MVNGFSFKNNVNFMKLNAPSSFDVMVGFPEGTPSADGGDQAEIARELSVGTDRFPARPFLDQGILSKKESIKKVFTEAAESLVKGQNIDKAAGKIGSLAVGAIQEFVRSDYYKDSIPNGPQTIADKGSDTPLIDTGHMINSLTYVVVKE